MTNASGRVPGAPRSGGAGAGGAAAGAGSARGGVAYAAAAYLLWGVFPLYFRALEGVPAPEILAHRISWSAGFMLLFVAARRHWPEVRAQLSPGVVLRLALSATLISSNWLIYIWAVNAGHVLDASLGYFVNPLVTVLLGVIFLREPLSRRQVVAIGLAALGVLSLVLRAGRVPWVALSLAGTFGLYGLIRKRVQVDATVGLLTEVVVLAPLAVGYLAWLAATGRGHLGETRAWTVLLAASGVVTAVPLLWFTVGVRRLRLATIGLLQYLNPTTQLVIAVALFGEPFSPAHRVAFACIWLGLAVYTSEALGLARRARA